MRRGRTVLAVVIYLACFTGLLAVVSHYYLIPALKIAAHDATREQKRVMAASAWLIMSVVLFVSLMGLLMTFRIGRFFFPRRRDPAKPTQYVDAWKEAGRRLKVPTEGDDEGP
jgi:uncharacterized membrane protein